MFEPTVVIFDMDGLMLDTELAGWAAYRKTAHVMGYAVEDELYLRTIGRNERDTRLIFIEHYGNRFDYDVFREEWQRRLTRIFESEGVGVKPGLFELLEHLEKKQVRLAVATSSARAKADQLLTLAGLAQRFHAIVCGDEVANGKPFPDIFLRAAETLSVPPSDCVVLEDSEPGILAAHAAGMRVIVVPDLKPPSLEVAQFAWTTCVSLHEVLDFLASCRISPKGKTQ